MGSEGDICDKCGQKPEDHCSREDCNCPFEHHEFEEASREG